MDNKYTVTFKMVRAGALYWKDKEKGITDTSAAGHLWYSLQKNNGAPSSFGFQSENGAHWGLWDKGLPTPEDDENYFKPDDSITIQINETQYNKLMAFGKNPANDGFDPSNYYGLWHNCVEYVFKALELIGYNPHNVEYDLTTPVSAFNEQLDMLARGKAIAVEGDKLYPLTAPLRYDNPFTPDIGQPVRDYKITGYNDSNDKIYGGKGRDTLIGKGGNDKLYGGEGDDTLYGDDEEGTSISNPPDLDLSNNNSGFSTSTSDIDNEKNSDILNGGEGKDTMYGGKGYDIYYIGGEDTIIDADGEGEIRFLDKNHQVIPEDEEGFSPTSPLEGHIVSFSPGSVIFEAEDYRFELSEETLTVTQESTGHKAIIKNSGLRKFAKTGKTGLSGIQLSDIAHCYDGCHNVIKIYYEEGRVLKPPYMGPNRPELSTEKKEENKTPENNVQENTPPANTFTAKSTQSQTTLNLQSRNKAIHHIRLLQANSRFIGYRLESNDLLLFGYNGADSLLIKGFYNSPHNLQNFRFSDRTLSLEQMKTEGITLSGTVNDDTMHDWNKTANTTFRAGKGNDKINAGDGNDTLIGGTGNDLLQGGNGKDTYMFEKGHGQDIITEFNTTKDDDTLQFDGLNFNQVKFRRDNYDLTLFGYHEQDSVTIKAFFANQDNQLENYQFSDRTLTREQFNEEMVLLNTQVNRMIQVAANFGAQSESGGISSTQEETKNLPPLAPSV